MSKLHNATCYMQCDLAFWFTSDLNAAEGMDILWIAPTCKAGHS